MSKIKVSKELADALDFALIERELSKLELLRTHVNKVHENVKWTSNSYQPFNKITNAELSDILFNDYEVE